MRDVITYSCCNFNDGSAKQLLKSVESIEEHANTCSCPNLYADLHDQCCLNCPLKNVTDFKSVTKLGVGILSNQVNLTLERVPKDLVDG